MATLMLAGDTHANTGHLYSLLDIATLKNVDYFFQVGDFGYWPHFDFGRKFLTDIEKRAAKLGRIVYWLDGNHDKWSLIDQSQRDDEGFVYITEHIRYAPRGHRWTWGGRRFLALGGAYSVDKAWRLDSEAARTRKILDRWRAYGASSERPATAAETEWFPEEEITWAELNAVLEDSRPVDIMLTHDKPVDSDLPWNRKAFPECLPNAEKIQHVVDRFGPELLVHGHLHFPYTDTLINRHGKPTIVIGLDADPHDEHPYYTATDSWKIINLGDTLYT